MMKEAEQVDAAWPMDGACVACLASAANRTCLSHAGSHVD